ncbi:plasmid replication protein RepC [Chelativorans salis]|uniref:Plasmid replication protein RepC n=1 Tax=Chelativorans salis TaxID=2978478 RepID=A0ABT2LTY4_9HYPH|nr:plasmid replication protein RepC [Chelativorans sp. EGI FJ00035]MCT7377990.1 plasmid replication protein RepC [Chelativorans sp. EGI FJ00035]
MSERFAVSPFGGKGLVRAQFAVNEQVLRARRTKRASKALADANSERQPGEEGGPDKWKLLRAITEARAALKLSNRTIIVLEALVSFCPERILAVGRSLVVFPSNAELSLRTRGMAPATLRRHLATLVEEGLVLRRDSANGKRYACRDEDGRIKTAFGFDLSALAVRAPEIEQLAAEARRQAAAVRTIRSEITIHLRDVAAILRAAEEEGRGDAFLALREELDALSGRLGRNTDVETLQRRRDRLVALRARVETEWLSETPEPEEAPELTAVNEAAQPTETLSKPRKLSANDAQNERHIESSDSEDSSKNKGSFSEFPSRTHSASPAKVDSCQLSSPCAPGLAITSVLSACPQIDDYLPGGIRGWHDLVKAADLVRTMLGISGETWLQARRAMGNVNAAIVVAAMLERADELKSPGAYLRDLAKRAEEGGFSPKPMLAALVSARLRRGRRARLDA